MIEIYGRPEGCIYCKNAKDLVNKLGVPYVFNNTNEESVKQELLSRIPEDVKDTQEGKTVPQIFVDGNYIGGYDKFFEYSMWNM
jgi:glutaredoxin 1